MAIKNLLQAELLVGRFFRGSEQIKKILQVRQGPDIYCYHFEMFQNALNEELPLAQEEIINKHLEECEWCRNLFEYFKKLSSEVSVALIVNDEATSYYLRHKILPDIVSGKSTLSQKIKKAWNIL